MARTKGRRTGSRLFRIAVGGSVAALSGGVALAQNGSPPVAPADVTDLVSLDLEDGVVDVDVDDEIAPDLDDQDSVDEIDSVDEETPDDVAEGPQGDQDESLDDSVQDSPQDTSDSPEDSPEDSPQDSPEDSPEDQDEDEDSPEDSPEDDDDASD